MFEIVTIITCFSWFELFFESYAGYISCLLAYKTLRAISKLFLSRFFQSSFSDGKCIPCQLYLFIEGLIFAITCGSFFISSQFNAAVTAYWKESFLMMGFIVASFAFYPIRRINIRSITMQIYFMTFIIK